MLPAGFEPAIPVSESLQTHDLDRTATGIGVLNIYRTNMYRQTQYTFDKRYLK